MNVFGVGLPEMAVIGAVAAGLRPKRLLMGRTLGKTLKAFNRPPNSEINKAG